MRNRTDNRYNGKKESGTRTGSACVGRSGFATMMLALILIISSFLLSGCITVNVPDNTSDGTSVTESGQTADDQTGSNGSGQSSGGQSDQGGDASGGDNSGAAEADGPGTGGGSVTGASGAGGSSGSSGSASEPAISEKEAIQIVLDRVTGSTAEEIVKFGRDYEDGRWEYEGKLMHDGIEYEFEIDGQNGNILDWEMED